MNLIICTGAGLVILLVAAALVIGLVFAVGKFAEWFAERWPAPKLFSTIGWNLFFCIVAGLVLVMSHDIGCKIIHLTARH